MTAPVIFVQKGIVGEYDAGRVIGYSGEGKNTRHFGRIIEEQ